MQRFTPLQSDEQSDARERRSRADLQWTINRRRPVIGDVPRLNQYSSIASNSRRLETDMNADSPTVGTGNQNALSYYRRLFFVHVGTVVITAALVVPLLLGVASIPSWLSVAYCVAIAIVALTFVVAAIYNMRDNRGIRVANRIECLVLTLALSMVQVIFVLPVLICIFAPTFRS